MSYLKFYRRLQVNLHTLIFYPSLFLKKIRLGKGVYFDNWKWQDLGRGLEIGNYGLIHSPSKRTLTIGTNVSIGSFVHISAFSKICIGNGVLMGQSVTIIDNGHLGDGEIRYVAPIMRPLSIGAPVLIGNNVWIADKVTICPGITIGDGAIIGANAVVTCDVEPYSTYAGIPAIRIK